MKFKPKLTLCVLVLLLVLQGCALFRRDRTPTPNAPTATHTATPSRTPDLTAGPDDTITPTHTPSPTVTLTPVATTQVAVITADAQVRRLTPSVFAGNLPPLPELQTELAISLEPGGMVTTGPLGQAEVVIQGCLKLFVFQDGNLQRSTCRREDTVSGLAVCSTGGMVMVLNECASLIDIQTPNAAVQTSGTWFSVIYLPQERLSVVQVYEGQVSVSAAIDLRAGDWEQGPTVTRGNLWFTTPGEAAPEING
ncbi:hypothetical protein FDZ74_11935, partial [bacterium]